MLEFAHRYRSHMPQRLGEKDCPQSHNQLALLIFRDLVKVTFSFRSLMSRCTKADSFESSCRNMVQKRHRDLSDRLFISMGKRGNAIVKKANVNTGIFLSHEK